MKLLVQVRTLVAICLLCTGCDVFVPPSVELLMLAKGNPEKKMCGTIRGADQIKGRYCVHFEGENVEVKK